MEPAILVLKTAFHHPIREASLEAGFERFASLTRRALSYQQFCDTVADCVAKGLIKEPVRLTEGALHCYWHLELTPAGVTAARPPADGSTSPGRSAERI